MQSIRRATMAFCLRALAAFPSAAVAEEAPPLGVVEAVGIATGVYIYGYPLITFYKR